LKSLAHPVLMPAAEDRPDAPLSRGDFNQWGGHPQVDTGVAYQAIPSPHSDGVTCGGVKKIKKIGNDLFVLNRMRADNGCQYGKRLG
jgi:hypothetical protein